jgi:(S)-2-hydroxyglutarate dehydrogenase
MTVCCVVPRAAALVAARRKVRSFASTSTSSSSSTSYDYVVIGAGIVGVNIATVLRSRLPTARVLVLEKGLEAGLHASGRNSGVLHAGFYYSPSSLKARLTREGNAFLTRFCLDKGIPLNRCGKLVVAKGEEDLAGLDTLLARGAANGVAVEDVTAEQARRLEPLVKTHRRALWSPSTAAADPLAVLRAQVGDAVRAGVEMRFGTAVTGVVAPSSSSAPVVLETGAGGQRIEAGHVVNCAGLHADRIAHMFGCGKDYKVVPFKGLYLYCKDLPLRRLVYPVPDLDKPFLGVHFTVTVDGKVKIGPTAIPALWREQYGSPDPLLGGFSLQDVAEVAGAQLSLLAANKTFRSLAVEEVRKYFKAHMVKGAAELVEGATLEKFGDYGRAGIRAQLMDTRTRTLVMDYLIEEEGGRRSTHVLNAVSPGWTSSRPFAELVVNKVLG